MIDSLLVIYLYTVHNISILLIYHFYRFLPLMSVVSLPFHPLPTASQRLLIGNVFLMSLMASDVETDNF